ncbi:MAG: aminotransferase, partial [Acidobacteriota bacterium]
HNRYARGVRAGLGALGFSLFTEKPFLADTLSVVIYPPGVEDEAFRGEYYENGVVVAGGLAETAGRVFRMGHMGNLSSSQIYFALDAMEKSLHALGHAFEPGASIRAAKPIIGE